MVEKIHVRRESLFGDELEELCDSADVEIPSLENLQKYGVLGAVAEEVREKYIGDIPIRAYAKTVLEGTIYEQRFAD